MVLENASGPSPDTFTDSDVPQTDPDPYATSSAPDPRATKVDASKWPKPVPIIGPLMGYTPEALQKILQRQVIRSTQVMGRELKGEEVEALGYWTAKSMSIQSYGPSCGIIAGLYRTQSTKSTYRFPFFTPDLMKMNVDVFPSDQVKWFSGKAAQNAWHTLRGSAYVSVGFFVGTVIFSSYAASVCAVGEMADPRLKGLIEALNDRAKAARAGFPSQNSAQHPGEAKVWKGQTRNVDDASPTGGEGGWGDSNLVPGADGTLTDEQIQEYSNNTKRLSGEVGKLERPYERVPEAQRSSPYNRTPSPGSQTYTGSVDDRFDDASPTGGKGMESTQPVGSAWERIRRQQAQGGNVPGAQHPSAWSRVQNSSQQQQQSSESKDPFDFTPSEK